MSDIKKKVQERVKEVQELIGDAEDGFVNGPPPPDFIHSCLHHRERGDGALFAYMQKGKRVYNNVTGEWYSWDTHYWKKDRDQAYMDAVEEVAMVYEGEAQRLWEDIKAIKEAEKMTEDYCEEEGKDSPAVKKIKKLQAALRERAGRLRGNNRVKNCVSFAMRIQDPAIKLSVEGELFDSNPWLLGCPNGVIDLRSGEFRPGRQDDYIHMACPTEFRGLDEPCPEWEKFLLEILEGKQELVDYLQCFLGYSITGCIDEHIFSVFQGRARNGKGTIIEVLQEVLGPLISTIRSEMLLAQPMGKNSSAPSPDIMALKGLRIAVASEVDERSAFSAGQVKLLTGGDNLCARNLHDKFQSNFKPTHTLILLTNDKPRCPDHDVAFWERMQLVKFPLSFVKKPKADYERPQIKGLAKILIKEASGILAWLVRGALAWHTSGGLNPPELVSSATEEYRKEEDVIGAFIEECCIVEDFASVRAAELYETYKEWHEKNVNRYPLSQPRFGKRIVLRFERGRAHGGATTYKGIGLMAEE